MPIRFVLWYADTIIVRGLDLDSASSAHTLRQLPDLDDYDRRSIQISKPITALEAWNFMTAEPSLLMRLAFGIRDAISALFGVKRIGGFSGKPKQAAAAGDKLDFFLVEHSADDMLVLTARDRHLDVMICISVIDRMLSVTSSVVIHNLFGRIYMLPVGPVHRLIVDRDMRRVKRKLEVTPLS